MLNPVFPNLTSSVEQNLLETNIIESIQIHGTNVYYLPRSGVNNDGVLGEDEFSVFNSSHVIECYLNSFEGTEGMGQFLSKFHLETRDELTITIAKARFAQLISERPKGPRDGDMIYIPLTGMMWEVLYSTSRKVYYQLGKLYTYQFKLSLMEFDNQVFKTGISEIDDKYNQLSTDVNQTQVDIGDLIPEAFDKSVPIQDLADEVLDFTETTPFSSTF